MFFWYRLTWIILDKGPLILLLCLMCVYCYRLIRASQLASTVCDLADYAQQYLLADII